jgi:predicted deacylase
MRLYEFIKSKHDFSSLKSKFEEACLNNNCFFEVLSKDSHGNEIFCCRGPEAKGKKVCIISGLHGDEPGGPYGVLEFFSKENIDKLKSNILLIPVMNPHGFEKDEREDDGGSDLNRKWHRKDSKGLVKDVKDVVIGFKPDLVLSLHEDSNADGFYLYPSEGIDKVVVNYLKKFLHTIFDPISNKTIYGDRVKSGVVVSMGKKPKHYASMEKFFEKSGIANVTLEIPGSLPLKKRTNAYSDMIVNFLNWYKG